ncbi:MAG: efflux RND transporter periplasmic adaptor subunit [Candidatus Polarisedimenticolia bacterium]
MAKKMILMLLAMAAFVTVIGVVKFRQVQAAVAQATSFQPPPEAVTTIEARQEAWEPVLSAIGTVEAVHGVTVSADLPGIVERIAFESGATVRAGELLVQLDTRQEHAQLAAAGARLDLARLNLERMRGLREKGVTSQAEYDTALAEHQQAEASVGEILATIARKTIRAPFTGRLGIRQVNLGQYVTGGDPIVPLQSLHPVHVNFTVPQQDLAALRPGGPVRVTTEGSADREWPGTITAIDSVVDPSTRNIQAQATLDNPGGALRPGMFVRTRVMLETGEPVVALPASAVQYAPYGDSVFVVAELKGPDGGTYRGVRQQVVKLGASRGDQIAVLSGVAPGEEVVTSGVFKLRNGAAVQVDNDVQPGNDPTPTPEEN